MRLYSGKVSLWAVLLLAPPLVGAGVGCYRAQQRDELRGPILAVERYFDAVARRDCAALAESVAGTLAKDLSESGCSAILERMRSHRVEYISSRRPIADGRDRNARIVPIQVRFNESTKDLVVRVSRSSSTWKLATL
jgi:hypothetical protein